MQHLYQYWQHKSGDVFAVMLQPQTFAVVGVTGPLDQDDRYPRNADGTWPTEPLDPSEFACDETDVDWINLHADDFTLWESSAPRAADEGERRREMNTVLDTSDTKRALVNVQPSGDTFIIEYCSVWRGEECVGTQVLRAAGPISSADLALPPAQSLGAAFDQIDEWQDLTEDDAGWLDLLDRTGQLAYPIGIR